MTTKTIKIKSLSLINFKGIRKLTINFKDRETFISGDNATGKTTVMDAFTFLLFGKDSLGRTDFNIKPLDDKGESIHNLEHEVNAVLLINNEPVSLKKIYKEKWTKPRGQKDQVFSGHETLYFYNDVPFAQKDYNTKIELICPEKLFKLLTNPHYFSGLNWSEQRQMLISVAGSLTDTEIAAGNKAYLDMISSLNGAKTIDEYKREIAMKKKRIKDQLEEIPARMDEVQRTMPQTLNWAEIENRIKANQVELERLDSEIADLSKGSEGISQKKLELQNAINKKKLAINAVTMAATSHIDNLKFEFDRKLRIGHNELTGFEETISQNQTSIKQLQDSITELKKKREEKIQEWHKITDETFSIHLDTICPTCGQQFPEDFLSGQKSEALGKFNTAKANRLQFNVTEGKKIAAYIVEAEKKIEACRTIIAETEKSILSYKASVVQEPNYEAEKNAFLDSKNHSALTQELIDLEELFEDLEHINRPDTSALEDARKVVRSTLDELKKQLSKRDYINSLNERLAGLKENQVNLSQELSNFEKIEFVILGFEKARIEALEARINGMFRIVRFKMFDTQINGGEKETCECTVEGVPYSDLNNAMKINAGIDILTTLSEKYGISAPVFIDNRESVNNLLEVNSQLVNLVVTKDKELVFC